MSKGIQLYKQRIITNMLYTSNYEGLKLDKIKRSIGNIFAIPKLRRSLARGNIDLDLVAEGSYMYWWCIWIWLDPRESYVSTRPSITCGLLFLLCLINLREIFYIHRVSLFYTPTSRVEGQHGTKQSTYLFYYFYFVSCHSIKPRSGGACENLVCFLCIFSSRKP